jgi:hypothetical protein
VTDTNNTTNTNIVRNKLFFSGRLSRREGLSYDPYLIRSVSKGSGPIFSGPRRPPKIASCLELPAIHEELPAHDAVASISHFISSLVLLLVLDSSFGRLKTYFSFLRPDGETFSGGSWASS